MTLEMSTADLDLLEESLRSVLLLSGMLDDSAAAATIPIAFNAGSIVATIDPQSMGEYNAISANIGLTVATTLEAYMAGLATDGTTDGEDDADADVAVDVSFAADDGETIPDNVESSLADDGVGTHLNASSANSTGSQAPVLKPTSPLIYAMPSAVVLVFVVALVFYQCSWKPAHKANKVNVEGSGRAGETGTAGKSRKSGWRDGKSGRSTPDLETEGVDNSSAAAASRKGSATTWDANAPLRVEGMSPPNSPSDQKSFGAALSGRAGSDSPSASSTTSAASLSQSSTSLTTTTSAHAKKVKVSSKKKGTQSRPTTSSLTRLKGSGTIKNVSRTRTAITPASSLGFTLADDGDCQNKKQSKSPITVVKAKPKKMSVASASSTGATIPSAVVKRHTIEGGGSMVVSPSASKRASDDLNVKLGLTDISVNAPSAALSSTYGVRHHVEDELLLQAGFASGTRLDGPVAIRATGGEGSADNVSGAHVLFKSPTKRLSMSKPVIPEAQQQPRSPTVTFKVRSRATTTIGTSRNTRPREPRASLPGEVSISDDSDSEADQHQHVTHQNAGWNTDNADPPAPKARHALAKSAAVQGLPKLDFSSLRGGINSRNVTEDFDIDVDLDAEMADVPAAAPASSTESRNERFSNFRSQIQHNVSTNSKPPQPQTVVTWATKVVTSPQERQQLSGLNAISRVDVDLAPGTSTSTTISAPHIRIPTPEDGCYPPPY